MEIKSAGKDQLTDIQKLGIQTYKDHYTHIWSEKGLEKYLEKQFSTQIVSAHLASKSIKYFLTYDQNNPVGIIKLKLNSPLPVRPGKSSGLELEKIYLLKNWTGKGYGSKMISFVKEKSVSWNQPFVWLDVLKTNEAAQSFYHRHGFATIGSIPFASDKLDIGMWVMKFK